MVDIITQASLIILEGYDPAMNRILITAREAFISIANACVDKDQPVTSHFETELTRRLDSGEIHHTIFHILWWNMEGILENYRQCLGLKPRVKKIKDYVRSKRELEKEIECSICLEKHVKKEALCIKSCQHEFGKDCLTEWLKGAETCPLCRANAKDIYGFKERNNLLKRLNQNK
jgi:hypothetical protein